MRLLRRECAHFHRNWKSHVHMKGREGNQRDGIEGGEEAHCHTLPQQRKSKEKKGLRSDRSAELWIDRSPGCALAPRSCAMAPLEMPLKEAAIELARMGFEPWLKAHGKLRRPDMNKKQALELRECFELIDAGGAGTGVISTREVPLAFTVLGMDLTRTEIDDAIREINANKRSMEFPAFMRLMLAKLDKLPVDEYSPSESGKDPSSEYTLPFALLAQAYRRKKLIEAVMGGDKKLQDRMNFRSQRSFVERKALRDVASGKAQEEPQGNVSMTLEPTEREKKRAKAAALKKHPRPQSPEPALPSYLIANVGSDVRELLVGEKRSEIIKAVLDSDIKFVPPTNKSIEIDRPLSGFGDKKLSPAYLREKLETFRTDMRHKPTMKRQVIRVQALKSLRDFYEKGSMQVKGSPFLYPAARRPTVAPKL